MRLVRLPSWRATRRFVGRGVAASGRRSKASPSGASAPQRPAVVLARGPGADREIGLALARYVPDLLRWARRCGVPARDAPDVVQVVLLRAWLAWEQCAQPAGNRAAWLFAFMVRVASEYARRAARHEEIRDPESLPAPSGDTPGPDAALEHHDAVDTLEKVGRHTTPERWRVFYAYEIDGVTLAALSKQEAAPIGTIYTRLRLARRDVRAAVIRHRAKVAFAESTAVARHEKKPR